MSLPFEIGGSYEFTTVGGMALGPAGRVAISQPEDHRVLVFSSDHPGAPIAQLGRKGEGPGEFSYAGQPAWIDRALLVPDANRPRVETFDMSGKLISSTVFDPPSGASHYLKYGSPVVLRDSALVYYPIMIGTIHDPTQMPDDSGFPVLLFRAHVQLPDTIARLHLLRDKLVLYGDRGTLITSQPFSNLTSFSTGADGRRILLVLQSPPATPDGHTLVRMLRPDGHLVFDIALNVPPRAVSGAEWDSTVNAQALARSKDIWASEDVARKQLRKFLVKPNFHPLVSAAFVGRDGSAWLRMDQIHNGVATWILLSPSGKPLGSVQLPRVIRLMDAEGNRVVGVRSDADGVDHPVAMTLANPLTAH
jgi:hypothetical protein